MKLIKMENGEKITFAEHDRRTKIKLRQKEALWQRKLQNPKMLRLLNRAKGILEQRLHSVASELNKLNEDDNVLNSVWEIGRSKSFDGIHLLLARGQGCPFQVAPFHHGHLREGLEERKDECESSLRNIKRLLSGNLGKSYKARPADFESPL
jgi:uncharacterized protein (DUF1015 family)